MLQYDVCIETGLRSISGPNTLIFISTVSVVDGYNGSNGKFESLTVVLIGGSIAVIVFVTAVIFTVVLCCHCKRYKCVCCAQLLHAYRALQYCRGPLQYYELLVLMC